MTASLSTRGQRSFSAFHTAIPEITQNLYDEKSNPSGIISLALSENVLQQLHPWKQIGLTNYIQHLVHGPVVEFMNQNVSSQTFTEIDYWYESSSVSMKQQRRHTLVRPLEAPASGKPWLGISISTCIHLYQSKKAMWALRMVLRQYFPCLHSCLVMLAMASCSCDPSTASLRTISPSPPSTAPFP